MRLQVQHRVFHQFHLLLNHVAHFYALTIAWTSATQVQPAVHLLVQSRVDLSVHLYIDLKMHLQVHYQVHPKLYYQAHIKHICRYSVCTGHDQVLGALKVSLLLSFFNWQDFASICTLKCIFESVLKCVPYTISVTIPISFGGAIWDFLV